MASAPGRRWRRPPCCWWPPPSCSGGARRRHTGRADCEMMCHPARREAAMRRVVALLAVLSILLPARAAFTEDKLGSVTFAVSCTAPAQQEFTRGLALYHSFYFLASVKAFTAVAGPHPPHPGRRGRAAPPGGGRAARAPPPEKRHPQQPKRPAPPEPLFPRPPTPPRPPPSPPPPRRGAGWRGPPPPAPPPVRADRAV